ncbi:hypothetical protein RMCBS344292_07265 [Rhizopus microsporus]|nr:hypothetical protein RMCBS344292_07265 [Rhizopus microsporus]
MTCPSQYINTKIKISTDVQNNSFFANNFIDQWSFMNFVRAQGQSQQLSLKDMKALKQEFVNSLFSLQKKSTLNASLFSYISKLINTKHTNTDFVDILNELKAPKINIVNSNLQHSNVIFTEGSSAVSFETNKIAENKGKRKLDTHENENVISIQRNKKIFSFIKPATPGIKYNLNCPVVEQKEKAAIAPVVYIKIRNNCSCDNEEVNKEYFQNMIQQSTFSCLKKTPDARQFLLNALEQPLEKLLFWLGSNGFHNTCSNEELKATLFVRLVLTDYYANCVKPVTMTLSNERTPFVEYVVPLFKYFSAHHSFPMSSCEFRCEKGLETNRYVSLYHADITGRKRLADGVGYTPEQSEVLLVESSGEDDEGHSSEDTLKLLECSIRALKLEMEKVNGASLNTFKKRRFLTCLYAGDKLTLMSTSLMDVDRWGFITVREAIVPRTWAERYAWGKTFELMFCLRDFLEEQKSVSEMLMKEDNGWIENGEIIFDKMKLKK